MADAVTVLPKLATGLDVNVRFTGVSDFEYTPECSVFDLLGVPLYHGWLVDPQVRGWGVGKEESNVCGGRSEAGRMLPLSPCWGFTFTNPRASGRIW